MSQDNPTEAVFDMDRVNALPEVRVPNEAELKFLCDLVEQGPYVAIASKDQEALNGLIEQGYAVEIVKGGIDGWYAANARGAAFYTSFYDATNIQEAKQKRLSEEQ